MKTSIVLLALLPAIALAGKPKHEVPDQVGIQLQGQLQGQIANGGKGGNADATAVGIGTGGDAEATAVGIGGEQSQGQSLNSANTANQSQSANNEGNSLEAGYSFKSKSLALALPGATADNGSTAPCLESKRGVSILGVGWSGRTAINDQCFAYQRCVHMAQLYATMDRVDLAVAQLQSCGGQTAAQPGPEYVTKEELRRRDERIVETVLAK